MDTFFVKLAIVTGIALLVSQALSMVLSPRQTASQRWTALLTASIALLIALNLYLTSSHLMVMDLADGLLLVQGSAHWLLRALVFGYVMAAALVVQSAVAERDPTHRRLLMFTAATLVGGWSAYHEVSARDSTETAAGTIYGYDLYAPWLLIWISGCVVDWSLLVAGLLRRDVRRWLSAMASLGAAGLGTSFAQGERAGEWVLAYWLTCGLAALFGLRVLMGLAAPEFYARHIHLRRTLLSVLLLGFLVPFAMYEKELQLQGKWVGASCCMLVLITLVWMGRRALVKDRLFQNGEGKVARYVLVLSLLVLLLLAIDFFFLKRIPDLWNLLGSAVASIVLVELAAEGPLYNVKAAAALWGDSSLVRRALERCGRALRALGRPFTRFVSWVKDMHWAPRTLIPLLLPPLLYVVIDEVPNAGRTVVERFDVYGDKESDAGHRLAELTVSRLNGIALDLDENMLIALPAALQESQGDGRSRVQQAAVHTSSAEADFANDVLDLGPLGTYRLGKVLAVIQRPIRRLLRTRYIEGALLQEAGGFRVVAHASTGQSWTYPHGQEKPADLLTLARYLAFEVLSTGSDWSERGMTLDGDAFEAFLDSAWLQAKSERLSGNTGTLGLTEQVIQNLRSAVSKDPSFAVAHYRLALALSAQGQYGGALEHLRAAVDARPGFGPAHDALARLLERGLDGYRPPLLRAISRREVPDRSELMRRLHGEARELWTRMIPARGTEWSLHDRAAAHLGLCALAMDEGQSKRPLDGLYNCTVAARIYASFPDSELAKRDRNRLLAYAYNALGVLRLRDARSRKGHEDTQQTTWGCSGGQFDGVSWRLTSDDGDIEATRLFQIAHDLVPGDTTIHCNLAAAEFAAGNGTRFELLRMDAAIQLAVCDELLELGVDRRGSAYFQEALDACNRALESDPLNTDALNLYAYVFRLWWYSLPNLADGDRAKLAGGNVPQLAEERARKAVQLAQDSPVEGYRGMIESTLGEVLLALGRPHEAMSWLDQATKHTPAHVRFAEIQRDHAEALICAREEDKLRTGRKHAHACLGAIDKADAILAKIRDDEALLESSLYADDGAALERESLRGRCALALRPPAPQDDRALRVDLKYPRRIACATKQLHVKAPAALGASVHLWGNGVRVTGDAVDFRHGLASSATHGQYFAQLIDPEGRPLSPPFTLDTRAGTEKGCSEEEDMIDLSFTLLKAKRPPLLAAGL